MPAVDSTSHTTYLGGRTDLKRRYGNVQPWRLPFHTSPVVQRAPISSKRAESQFTRPLLRKNFEILAPKVWIFVQILALNPSNLKINFSPQDPRSEAKISSQAPHFGNPGCTSLPPDPYLKKSCVPPPPPRSGSEYFCALTAQLGMLWYTFQYINSLPALDLIAMGCWNSMRFWNLPVDLHRF